MERYCLTCSLRGKTVVLDGWLEVVRHIFRHLLGLAGQATAVPKGGEESPNSTEQHAG